MSYWGFILDLKSRKLLRKITPLIVNFISEIPLDERAYLFQIGSKSVPLRKAQVVAQVIQYMGEEFELGEAMQYSAYVIASDLNAMSCDRHIVAFTDRLADAKLHKCLTALSVDRRDGLDTDYQIFEFPGAVTLKDHFPSVRRVAGIEEIDLGELLNG